VTRGLGLVQAYEISSAAGGYEQGDLTVKAGGGKDLRLVVFPFRNGATAPILGAATKPVVIPKWQTVERAVVWLIQGNEDRQVKVGIEVKMPGGPVKEMWVRDDSRVNPGRMSLKDEGRSVTLDKNKAVVTEPGGRSFLFTWTPPPPTLLDWAATREAMTTNVLIRS
jgi:hypothetical protein